MSWDSPRRSGSFEAGLRVRGAATATATGTASSSVSRDRKPSSPRLHRSRSSVGAGGGGSKAPSSPEVIPYCTALPFCFCRHLSRYVTHEAGGFGME